MKKGLRLVISGLWVVKNGIETCNIRTVGCEEWD